MRNASGQVKIYSRAEIELLQVLVSNSANSAVTPQPHSKILSTEDLHRKHFTGFPFGDTISSKGYALLHCNLLGTLPLVGKSQARA